MIEVVKYGASWCAPCKTLDPLLKRLQDERGAEVHVVSLDVSEVNPEVLAGEGITSVPVVFVDGVRSVGGPACTAALKALLKGAA